MNNIDNKELVEIIAKLVLEKLQQHEIKIIKEVDRSGVISIKGSTVKCETFDTGKEGDKVYLKDILSLDESPRLGCGFMEMKNSSFPWTLKYDEIDYIIEGTLEIIINGNKIRGNAGDVIFIPVNSSIEFSTPDYVKFIYVTYPANWADL
ncbi:cupin domain-containing protein [Lutispora thermophila]|uniref:Ethanolamine utilization protein EutQ n=1 Tax=Lutispora thermophila DSM 19022 TaxID=1122184 RepID=A0A1M6FJL6_9FIRM|nr:cupin domain-containing protein [Lutispora thermophila]SHI97812.1 ethanolamine utilization protein EutQ [Lutispora thermophila DSM 19022]